MYGCVSRAFLWSFISILSCMGRFFDERSSGVSGFRAMYYINIYASSENNFENLGGSLADEGFECGAFNQITWKSCWCFVAVGHGTRIPTG